MLKLLGFTTGVKFIMLLNSYSYCLLFLAAGIVFVLGSFITSWLLRPNKPSKEKTSPYECGEFTTGTSFVQYNVRYYLFALIFVVFDVEIAFLLPWAVIFKECGVGGFLEAAIFIFILLVGLFYAWKKKALEWL